MRIVLNQEMRELDRQAIEDVGLPSIVLMENAGLEAAKIISSWAQELDYTGEILIFCGKGKNGGDGLVVARHLLSRGHKLRIFLCNDPSHFKSESKTNLDILTNLKAKMTIADNSAIVEEYFKSASAPFLVVDAILGTGLDRDLEGHYFEIIEIINQKATEVIALDIPSGIRGDTGRVAGTSIQASATISFGYPRIGHFLPPGAARRGRFYNIDLGFPRKWSDEGDMFLLNHDRVAPLVQHRDRFGHKNSFGHCMLIGGSEGRLGAIVMASQSCLKMGTGLVTVASWGSSFPALDMKIPSEVMTYKINSDDHHLGIRAENFLSQFSSIVVGPGLGVNKEGAAVVRYLLENYRGPIVIDADGLNIVAEFRMHDLLMQRREPCVLTPHPGEMSRLLQMEKSQVVDDPVGSLRQAVERTGAIVVLKGATTLIHSPEGITYVNHYPNDGMAKAGSGDVLAGMIGGLIGQRMAKLDAVRVGVYAHTLAGRFAADGCGERAMTATDITSHIEVAFKDLIQHQPSRIAHATIELF